MRYARGLLEEIVVLAMPPTSAPDAANQQTASGGTTPEPPSSSNPFDVNSHFSPTMIIILVILVSAFFFMGFFAVYVRRCSSEESLSQRGGSRRTARQDELNAGQQGSGVDPLLVESYPMVSYVTAKKKGCNECVVCLGDFEGGEELKQLPKCKHVFHPACIGLWLESHTTCPLCRRSLVNTDRWSVSLRWGGSSRGVSLSTRLSGDESSHSCRGGETASPWLRRVRSSTGWLFSAGRNEDASSRSAPTSVRGGVQEETSIRVLDASPSCEPPSSLLSSSQQQASVPLSEVATPAEEAPRGLAGSPLATELLPRGLGIPIDLMPPEIEEWSERVPRGSGQHASRVISELATNASSEVAKSGPVESRKPRETGALQGRRRLNRSNSTGHSLRRRAALQATGCMPSFSLHRSRSVEEGSQACATSEHAPLSGSSCASHIPHEPCLVSTSAPFPAPP